MTQSETFSRLVVVDDHSVVRHGLVALLSRCTDMKVVGQAGDGEAAVRVAADLQPDIALMDVRMPGMDGLEACRQILRVSPKTRVVFLTSFPDEEALVEAMLAGAKGYVLKNLEDVTLLDVIRAVARGESVMDPSPGATLARGMQRMASGSLRSAPAFTRAGPGRHAPPAGNPTPALTENELALLRLIAEGRTNREIADCLHYTEKTIRNYVSALLAKLHLRNRAEAAAFAVTRNLSVHE